MFLTWVSVVAVFSTLEQTYGNSVTQTEGTITVPEGKPVLLNCTYKTSGSPVLFWWKGGLEPGVSYIPGAALGDSVQSKESQVSGVEGASVTFSCSYKTTDTSGVYLSWYRQSPNRAPQYILRRGTKLYAAYGDTADFAQERFSSQADESSILLNITALELADIAVYYCALQRAQ
ncbi:Ig lambda chain V-I region BL2 [Chelonia mydas]|uniref:Ig lambda chain V-I region BL2 n=1 Tax=Chelonia mydas TaxID=8469 RepID=M7C1P7_CHEMY|nr:Ig lambda chain V-I region BL2 [Chelonia mydas]